MLCNEVGAGGSEGFTLDFDPAGCVLRLRLHGKISDEILCEACDRLQAFLRSADPCNIIEDMSDADLSQVTSRAVRGLAERPYAVPKGYLRVLVGSGLAFGLARMYQAIGREKENVLVVSSLEEAYAVLNVVAPTFSQRIWPLPIVGQPPD